jgi:molecular chaperone GrpE
MNESADPSVTPSEAPASSEVTQVSGPPDAFVGTAGAQGSVEDAAVASAEPSADSALVDAQANAAKFREQALRAMADLDNFRKRTRKEIDDARKGGKEDLLKELLPVFDNVERAIASAASATEVSGVVNGLQMVLRQLSESLTKNGVQRIKSVGHSFDPQLHEAIQQLETDEHPVGTIVAEVQPGYLNGERLVRAALVVVAKPKSS